MKKTKMTMVTSAILSMAAYTAGTTSNSTVSSADIMTEMYGVYGPPPVYSTLSGDVSDDNEVNIADVCLLKGWIIEEYQNYYPNIDNGDVNKDGQINWLDFNDVRNYFLGLIPDLQSDDPNPLLTDEPSSTTQPVYGPPGVTYPPTTTTPPMQTKYGPPWIFPDYTKPQAVTQPEYEQPQTTEEDIEVN